MHVCAVGVEMELGRTVKTIETCSREDAATDFDGQIGVGEEAGCRWRGFDVRARRQRLRRSHRPNLNAQASVTLYAQKSETSFTKSV